MKISTISHLKQNAANLDLSEPLCVTQNGLPTMVVMAYDQYTRLHESLALVKLLGLADKDIEAGKLVTGEELLARLSVKSQVALSS